MSAWGAFIGLLVSIFLIIRKVSPVYSLILGALVGGLLGGVSLPETVSLMISGVNDVTPAVIRILTAIQPHFGTISRTARFSLTRQALSQNSEIWHRLIFLKISADLLSKTTATF